MKQIPVLFLLLAVNALYSMPFSSESYRFSIDLPEGFRKVLDKEVENGIRQYRFSSADERASFDVLVALNNPDYGIASSLILKGIGVSVTSRENIPFKNGKAEKLTGIFNDGEDECYIEGMFVKISNVFYAIGCYTYYEDKNNFASLFKGILKSFTPFTSGAEDKKFNNIEERGEISEVNDRKAIQEDKKEAKRGKNNGEKNNKNDKYKFSHDWFFYKKWNLSFEMNSYTILQSKKELMNIEKINYKKFLNVLPNRIGDEEVDKIYRNYVFQAIYENNKERLDTLFLAFEGIRRNFRLDDEDFLNLLISFVQSFKIKEEWSSFFKVLPPPLFLLKKEGNSATKSLFLKMLLERFGYDCVLYCSSYYIHYMVGINVNGSGSYRIINGKKYYFLETAEPGWKIGMVLPAWNNLDWWYPVELK